MFEKFPTRNKKEIKPSLEQELSETDFYPILNTPLQQRYDRIANRWNDSMYETIRRDDLIPHLLESARLRDGFRALETMCGTALLAQAIKEQYSNSIIYALDFSQGMLNMAPDSIHKIQSSVVAMPFPDSTFDRIFLRNALYDLPKRLQLQALREIERVLRPDGIFLLQTYSTTSRTQVILNDIVNMKDKLAGQYQDMGKELPRYFAMREELEGWFREAGLRHEITSEFISPMRYQKNSEMSELAKQQWGAYVSSISNELQQELGLEWESDGTLTYSFPGIVYRLMKD